MVLDLVFILEKLSSAGAFITTPICTEYRIPQVLKEYL